MTKEPESFEKYYKVEFVETTEKERSELKQLWIIRAQEQLALAHRNEPPKLKAVWVECSKDDAYGRVGCYPNVPMKDEGIKYF